MKALRHVIIHMSQVGLEQVKLLYFLQTLLRFGQFSNVEIMCLLAADRKNLLVALVQKQQCEVSGTDLTNSFVIFSFGRFEQNFAVPITIRVIFAFSRYTVIIQRDISTTGHHECLVVKVGINNQHFVMRATVWAGRNFGDGIKNHDLDPGFSGGNFTGLITYETGLVFTGFEGGQCCPAGFK